MRKGVAGLLLMVLCPIDSGADTSSVIFKNALSACVDAKGVDVLPHAQLVLARTILEVRKPIGECGCTSALATYSSSVVRDGLEQEMQRGLIGLVGIGERLLVLSTEPTLVSGKQITVRLNCAAPR